MKQNWKQFGMNFAQPSVVEMTNRDHCKRLLSGAVFEYLDEERVEEFVYDLIEVLVEENKRLLRRVEAFSACAKLIEKGLTALAEEEEAVGEAQ